MGGDREGGKRNAVYITSRAEKIRGGESREGGTAGGSGWYDAEE